MRPFLCARTIYFPSFTIETEGTVSSVFRTKSIDRLMADAAASGEGTLARMIEVGRRLKDDDGADVVVMGCAGMARHRVPLEQALGVPVIDPTQAAVTMAIGTVQLARS